VRVCVGKSDIAASHPQSVDAAAAAAAGMSVKSDVAQHDVNSDVVELDVSSDSVHRQPLLDTTNSIVIIGESVTEAVSQKHFYAVVL